MKDLFSSQSSGYAAFRPTYPKTLYNFILSNVKHKDSAWDCATGNGQVAFDLASSFKKIEAVDISSKQIENARKASTINYSISPAEKTTFADASFDLITVGQAIHWFDIPAFYNEVRRVAKPNAVLAVWGYGLLRINPEIDKVIDNFYTNIIGPYWDAERKLIDTHYSTIEFPFEKIKAPEFSFSFSWTIEELEGYLTTWSAVQKFIKTNSTIPVPDLIAEIRKSWGGGQKRNISFPLFLKCGLVR